MRMLKFLSMYNEEDTIIHGNRFIEHNVKAHPSEMFIEILPVPSLVVCGSNKNFMSPLRKKLNQILFWNNQLRELLEKSDKDDLLDNPPAIDILDILTWQVYTYMDNAIPGIQSDTELPRGIAQMIGTECRALHGTDLNSEDVAGTHLQRVVRGINMGETTLVARGEQRGDDGENLAFELAKQVGFRRIWKKGANEVQVMHIDHLGEVNRMEQGVIEDFEWTSWDGQGKLSRDIILAPRYARRRPSYPNQSEEMMNNLAKIKEINEYYVLEVESHRALTYLHSLCDGFDLAEPTIVVCDVNIDQLMLRPVTRKMETLKKMGANICLIMTNSYMDNRANYAYSATPDEYRNLIIAITEIRERKEFNHKDKMFEHLDENTIQLISTYFSGFTRRDIVRIVGSSILSKSKIDVDYIREYVAHELGQTQKSTSHLKPRPRKKHRKLTLEELHDQAGGRFIEWVEGDAAPKKNPLGMTNIQIPKEQRTQPGGSLYDSLKGMEPLVRWIQNKGRLFSPEAKEFGFIRYPTGLLLTGVPGCGKTMTGKIIAQEWGMDFKRVNVDDIISRFVGGNEDNMAKLLKELDERAPIVCFVDEADKLFTDMSNAPAHHVAHATMSTESLLLQFMEENTKPIFFVFTANEISNLSGPLVDRFDESFFVDLPSQNAREQIIQLMLYERKKGDLGLDAGALAELSRGFSGRDIRSAIEEGMMGAFMEGRELEQGDLVKSFNQTVPTSTLQSKKIKEMRKLVKDGKIRSANTDPWTEKWA